MEVSIAKVNSRKQLRSFIKFPLELYKGCENWVPPLEGDEYDTFNPKKNGAFEYCDADCFLAYSSDKVVGRVAAIINHAANEKWGEKSVRFGWLDFIEEIDVLKALIAAVSEWGRERGCEKIKGPWGFTDMDKEGLLVEGYDKLCPFTCLYNYPYYDTMLKELGFVKDVDWTQRICYIGEEYPPMFRHVDTIQERYGLKIVRPRTTRELAKKYGMSIFHMYNEAFAPLSEFSPLSDSQIRMYLKTYVPILSPKYVAVCVDRDDNPVGFAFCVPTLSKAVKKSSGRLFPFGFIRILRALRKNDTLEALMIGILPKYQGKGASILMFKYLHENCEAVGINKMIMNPQLEDNIKVQTLFKEYRVEPYMRRRAYIRDI